MGGHGIEGEPVKAKIVLKCSLGGKGEKRRHRSQDADHVDAARTAIRFTACSLRAYALVAVHLDRKWFVI